MEYMSYFNGCSSQFNVDDDYPSYDSDSDESYEDSSDLTCEFADELDSAEKVYICDYDKIYISMYEDIEKYRTLKQAKKKNISSNWNDLTVILQDGKKTNIKKASETIYKNVIKSKPSEKVKINNFVQPKPIVVTINHNSPSTNEKNKINLPPKELPNKQNKVEKLSKKQLKKQRQKEKKETQKQKQVEKNKDVQIQKLEEINQTNSKTIQDSKDNCKNEDDHEGPISNNNNNKKSRSSSIVDDVKSVTETEETDETGDDQNLLDENTAFISNALKKTEKKDYAKTKKNVESRGEKSKKSTIKPTLPKENINVKKEMAKPVPLLSLAPISLPSTSGLPQNTNSSSMKKPKTDASNIKESISLGKKAITLLLNNEINKAIQFLNESIRLNSHELRHYLNRSFCFLRLGEFTRALKDSEFVMMTTNDNELLVTAKFRAGQANCGLQNFKEAEKSLNEAYNLNQSNSAIFEELLRVKVLQLLSMGFRERDILETLYHCPTVEGVVSLLAEKTINNENSDFVNRSEDEDLYYSDDEENPSLTRLFRRLSTYQQSFKKKLNITTPSPLKTTTIPQPTKVQPKITTTIIPKVPINKDVNDKAIWIGNTTPNITEASLKKTFSKYGKIISLYRKPNENYTFINYENAKSVRELLSGNPYVEVDNVKLPIKSATRNK